MADVTQQVLIEFISSTEGLAPAVDQLEKLGTIDKATAAAFKATNAELKAREATLKATAIATKNATDSTKKSIADVDAAVKNLTNDFTQGFNEGVIEALKEAGVSVEEFQAAMAKMQQSGKGVAQLEQEVAALTSQLEALKKSSQGGGTEIESLTAQLAEQQKQLTELQAAYEKLKKGQDDATDKDGNARKRLKEIIKDLERMRATGENATDPERYKALTDEAGRLRSAFGDVADEIDRAGSNTGAFDSLLQLGGGITGAFAAAQGAVGLFADESEELQEVLLRVNSAMAILQGFQQVQALYAARATVAIGLQAAATNTLSVAQQAYNFVVGQSIGLMRVLRIAFAATIVGALILGFIELTKWLTQTSRQIKQLVRDMQEINAEFENGVRVLDAYSETIRRNSNEDIATLEANNILASEISKQRINDAQLELQAVLELEKERRAQFELSKKALIEFNRLREEGDAIVTRDGFKKLEEEHLKYVQVFEELEKRRLNAAAEIRTQQVAREKQLNEEALQAQISTTERAILLSREGSRAQLELQQKLVRDKLALDLGTQALTEAQRLQLIEQSNRDQLELRLAFNRRAIELEIRNIEDRLKSAEAGSADELSLRIELVRKQAAAELSTTKLSEAEKSAIRQEAINEQIRMELAFAAEQRRIAIERAQQVRADIIQAAIARNAADLALAEQGSEERLHLEIVNIELAASEARRVAGQNALEINRINAEAQAQILALKRQFAESAVEYEIRLEVAKNGRLVRSFQRVLSDERSTFSQRVQAINELFLIEVNAIDRRKQALRDLYAANLITQKEYNVQYAELEDERARISEETEQQILNSTKERTRAQVQAGIELSSQLVGVLDSVFQNQANTEQARIEQQRRNIDELREAGAITEKEADARRRKLEIEERQAQQRQAQRDKQIAVFRALLAIPSAFLQGAAQGGPILGAIYAAIAAAQAAIIISQPIPKFGKGKKNNYEGLAEVGETGSELIESNGQMYIAPKRTIVWLGSRDKVYNPKETVAMLEKPGLRAARLPEEMGVQLQSGVQFDYDKLGQAIAKNQKEVSLNIDGYKQFIINGHSFTTYLNARRGY